MTTHPNIVLFLTDDHGAWANGSYGNADVRTPTLDRLANEGVRFENAFTPTPVCSPARACVLTGLTSSQVGIHDWLQEAYDDIGRRDWLGSARTLFEYFKAADYMTGLSGKWHLGQSHLAPKGADYHFGLPGWQGIHNEEYTYVKNGEDYVSSENKSKLITDHAIEFLDNVPDEQPFFLNVGYIATHSPYHKTTHDPAMTQLYENCEFIDIPSYKPHDWVKNEGFSMTEPTTQDLRDHYIGYYAAVTEIDNNVARIIEHLEARGLADNTIIIYTSDHGLTTGHHGFWGKGNSTRPLNMYETSLRIPLIFSGAGVVTGQAVQHNITHYDTFQTILDLADLHSDTDKSFPGKSYLQILQGDVQAWDETVYGEYGDLRMIRTPEYKLVMRYPRGPHDFFDLSIDPQETTNQIHNQAYQDVIDSLKIQLEAFYDIYSSDELSGLKVKQLHRHNDYEAWRDGLREERGLQIY